MRRSVLAVVLCLLAAAQCLAGEKPRSNAPAAPTGGPLGVIIITDSGWSTPTGTSDCVTGWGDDTWQLTLTQPKDVTITVADCCCPGDYYQVYVDDRLVGTTPNLAPPWGCDFIGPNSTGSFRVPLCPGTHTIKVRDAGFDGHSLEEILAQNMCPAGFTVSGTLAPPALPTAESLAEASEPGEVVPIPEPSAEVQKLQGQIAAVEPFVKLNPRGLQKLDIAGARRAGVSTEALELARRLIALNNRIVAAAQAGVEAPLDRRDFEFIEPLFLYIAQAGDPCTDRQHPAACPPRVDSGRFFSTEQETRQYLESQGYHQTAGYAGGGTGRDFTKVVAFPGCSCASCFRSQAISFQRLACWTYNIQQPEPNPEILGYIWPYWSWGVYVRWWHLTFC